MSDPIEKFWSIRLNDVKHMLEQNKFRVVVADSLADARAVFEKQIMPSLSGVKTVSFGGSVTVTSAGIADAIREDENLILVDPYEKGLSKEQQYERRRQGLLVDLFVAGTNAVTACGKLVNLDGTCNRVAAINFGPKNVVLFVGRNKLVETVDDAMCRIKDYAAPVNAMRLDRKTPCASTGHCMDCSSPQRICNTWAITEKSFPAKRITVVLINEDCGF